MSRTFCSYLLASALFLTAISAQAAPILVNPGSRPTTAATLGDQFFYAAGAVDWTQTSDFSNVSIQALMDGLASFTGNAYVMNAIGPSATVAKQLAIASISFTGDPNASLDGITVNLFNGLSLRAGTYYLVLSGNGSGNNGGWLIPNTPLTTVGAGVTNLKRYGWIVSKGPGVVAPSYAPARFISRSGFEHPDTGARHCGFDRFRLGGLGTAQTETAYFPTVFRTQSEMRFNATGAIVSSISTYSRGAPVLAVWNK